jgi:hypothetical protein
MSYLMFNRRVYTELLGFWTFPIVWYSREHDVSKTETMEKVQKPSNSVCYTLSSEPFRIDVYTVSNALSYVSL